MAKKLIYTISYLLLKSYALNAAGILEIRAPSYPYQNAEYSTSHVFIDEVAGTTANIEVRYNLTNYSNLTDVEAYTNLNRRQLARKDKDDDGYPDGIQPVNGNLITDSAEDTDPTTGHYYIPINLEDSNGDNIWEATISANATGAYRLTARFKTSDAIQENEFNPEKWIYYGLRDHAIVVSPENARDIRMYEINVFNIEASGDTFEQRSTFEDLHNAEGAAHNDNNRWDLNYLKNLGMNWLWFQPIHPNGIEGRPPGDDPGSPYAVKNFFEINELMSIEYNGANTLAQNRATSMAAFQSFVSAADTDQVNIMLDAPFNHTAHDVELAQVGVDLFQPDGQTWSPLDLIRDRETRFFSTDGNYGNRATSAGSIAVAPDRYDFGKWNDVKDVFFGRYDALVEYNSEPELSSFKSEDDWFDFSDSDWIAADFTQDGKQWNVTRRVWDYFAEYTLFWLEKTRPQGQNRNSVPTDGDLAVRYAWDQAGIDGLRCDFGQGLPPRAWEYIINVTRTKKWNFIMMSETLDGGTTTYRSSRHFDVLNEKIAFELNPANDKYAYRAIFDNRRNAYGQGLVLLNNTSHDEQVPSDPWDAAIRSAVTGLMDGATMIFPGQELGIANTFGYQHYEFNFGKNIPHFKRWNSMMPIWNDNNFGNDQLYPVYSAIQTARRDYPSLASANRWFLDGDGNNSKIFAAAKYETHGASPASSDVVIGFVNVDRNNAQSDNFKIPTELADRIGIQANRTYNVKNVSAYTAQQVNRRDIWLWQDGISGANLITSGFFVSLNKVPTTDEDWSTAPYEPQYLKLYDTTPPPAPQAPTSSNMSNYVIGQTIRLTWNESENNTDDDNIEAYRLIIKREDSSDTIFNQNIGNLTSYTFNGTFGDRIVAQVHAISAAGIESPASNLSSSIALLNPADDEDNDGMSNDEENRAGTDPFDANSVLRILNTTINPQNQFTFSWSSVVGITYGIESSIDLSNPAWVTEAENIEASSNLTSWSDPAPINPISILKKFYRICGN